MEAISHLDLINLLAQRRMALITHESSFADLEEAVFQLEARDALDIDMLKAVLAPYYNTAIDLLDELDALQFNEYGFDAIDLIIDTVNPDILAEIELLMPEDDENEEAAEAGWEAYWEMKIAAFFAIVELHFGIYDSQTADIY